MKKLMEKHDFTIAMDEQGYPTITITQLQTGKVKEFYLRHSSGIGYVESLTNFMNSMTDDLCAAWFKGK